VLLIIFNIFFSNVRTNQDIVRAYVSLDKKKRNELANYSYIFPIFTFSFLLLSLIMFSPK